MKKYLLIILALGACSDSDFNPEDNSGIEYFDMMVVTYHVTPGSTDSIKGQWWSNRDGEYKQINYRMCTDKNGNCGSINHIITPARDFKVTEIVYPGDSISFTINRWNYQYGTTEITIEQDNVKKILFRMEREQGGAMNPKKAEFRKVLTKSDFRIGGVRP